MTEDLLQRARQAVRSAKTLLSTGDLNGTVNRAYYAMFYAAHAALAHRGIEAASSKHGILVAHFGQHLVKTRLLPRSLGKSLNQMLELRQRADYSGTSVTPVDAERGLSQAEAFVAAVERLIRG